MTLKEWFEKTGTKPAQLAARIGRSPSTITRILRGETLPSWTTIELIEKATDGAVGPNDYRRRAA